MESNSKIELVDDRILVEVVSLKIDGYKLPESKVDSTKAQGGVVAYVGPEVKDIKAGETVMVEAYHFTEIVLLDPTKIFLLTRRDNIICKFIK